MASSTGGKESVTSTARMMAESASPPKKPAMAPSVTPMKAPTSTTMTAMGMEWEAP